MMIAAGINPYDHNIKVDLNLSFDLGALLGNIDLNKLLGVGKTAVKGIIKKSPIKPGTKTKEKAGDAAPIVESKVVNTMTTDNQDIDNDTLDPQEKE